MVDDLRKASMIASGKVGTEWVYQKNGVRREYVIPTNPQTGTQQAWRGRFGDALRELVIMGDDLHQVLKDGLGYRWHARIIGRCLEDGGSLWDSFLDVWDTFDAGDQADWAQYDQLGGLLTERGGGFFAIASVVHYLGLSVGFDAGYDEPTAGNAAEVAAIWEREADMIYLTQEEADLLYVAIDTTPDWILPTLLNNWVNFGSSFNAAEYRKDQNDVVYLRGTVKNGTLNSVGFNLPTGYRPSTNRVFATVANGAFAYVVIYTDGNVLFASASNVSFSLDGISFQI